MIVDNEITRSDFEKSLKLQGLESFNSDQVSAWLNDNKKLIEKSKVEELDELEKSALDEFKVNAGSLKKVIVVEDNLEKSIVFVRPQQVDWDKDENGEILKSRAGTYKDTPENRKLGRVGQKFGSKKEAGEKKDESKDKKKQAPFKIPNIDESLAEDYYSGKMSLKEVAQEYNESGSTKFVDMEYARKKMEQYKPKKESEKNKEVSDSGFLNAQREAAKKKTLQQERQQDYDNPGSTYLKEKYSNKQEAGEKKDEGKEKENKSSGGKSKAAAKVLQLMDSEPDGETKYGQYVSQVVKEMGVDRKTLEEELDKYI